MKMIFMGTPDFSVPILRGLVEAGYNIQTVVTQPDRPKGRKKKLTPPPVKEEAQKHGLPVFQPETLKDRENLKHLLQLEPDMIVTAAFGQILPEELLEAPRYGAINVHASLLPKYRGGAPIHYAVMNGEEKTGVTIMYMAKQLDAGDILTQTEVEITKTDTTGNVHDKLSIAGRDLLLETLPDLAEGNIRAVTQNEKEATFAPNIKRGQEQINWNRSGETIYNHIRGMNPWPVAFTTYRGKPFKIWQARLAAARDNTLAPGTIEAVKEDSIMIKTGDSWSLELTELQPSGKKRMKAADYLRGNHPFETGEQCEYDE
ncbi:methionyl-tRNA formyltransferase [Alteribacillus persepolensis]|uniref:Methionyl-tRNA formyltransferase n=1 Tax=Alteribacillus persepolensis TaxID=568899 RepID=A0A1G7YIA5_9BACI|nr:methionyl-tRNA formyltransferase [Alteribacillus persepolensis]SDG96298.1 methionyl-tRNA formyltransferase [Alteribacillus persepolensis]